MISLCVSVHLYSTGWQFCHCIFGFDGAHTSGFPIYTMFLHQCYVFTIGILLELFIYFMLQQLTIICSFCLSVSFKAFYQLHQSVCFSLHVFFFLFWSCRQEGLVQWGLLALRGRQRKEGKKQTKTFLRYCKTKTLRIVSNGEVIILFSFINLYL